MATMRKGRVLETRVETDESRAREWADQKRGTMLRRDHGPWLRLTVRTYKRTVSADGAQIPVFVVIVREPGERTTP